MFKIVIGTSESKPLSYSRALRALHTCTNGAVVAYPSTKMDDDKLPFAEVKDKVFARLVKAD